MNIENKISITKNVLVIFEGDKGQKIEEIKYLRENFCGEVVNNLAEIQENLEGKRVYICGDISKLNEVNQIVFVIKEFSYNYENGDLKNIQLIVLGQVPIIIHHAGVYFRNLFGEGDYFNKVKAAHEFQHLTESNKQGRALRTGIYLTDITREETTDHKELLHYRLLRCSSNFTGPTDNFRQADREIMKVLNEAAQSVFEQETDLNHVLAQIYENKKRTGVRAKETKAKIKAHSDKTKDMPKDGLIAFCTFYDKANFQQLQASKTDRYDWCYKNKSGLTRLHFKLKKSVEDDTLVKDFSITLYPNSAFIIPLSTNRLYTHEIRPSMLNVDRVPTRMGYVVRCSKMEAVFMDDQTYIKENGNLIKLEPMTNETLDSLRSSYYEENKTENRVVYGKVHFSMNLGDYWRPIY